MFQALKEKWDYFASQVDKDPRKKAHGDIRSIRERIEKRRKGIPVDRVPKRSVRQSKISFRERGKSIVSRLGKVFSQENEELDMLKLGINKRIVPLAARISSSGDTVDKIISNPIFEQRVRERVGVLPRKQEPDIVTLLKKRVNRLESEVASKDFEIERLRKRCATLERLAGAIGDGDRTIAGATERDNPFINK